MKRLGKYNRVPGLMQTLTYDPKKIGKREAWASFGKNTRRFINAVNQYRKRRGWRRLHYLWVVEVQTGTGYPHVHIFYPRLHWLLAKEDVQSLWNVGRSRIEYARNVHIGGYVCKYITKMGGWSDDALAFIWKNRVRMYSYSRCYALPVEEKMPAEWAFLLSTTRTRISENLSYILKALPEIDNIVEYLEGS